MFSLYQNYVSEACCIDLLAIYLPRSRLFLFRHWAAVNVGFRTFIVRALKRLFEVLVHACAERFCSSPRRTYLCLVLLLRLTYIDCFSLALPVYCKAPVAWTCQIRPPSFYTHSFSSLEPFTGSGHQPVSASLSSL